LRGGQFGRRQRQLPPALRCFADLGASQCGYCTPGILITARALLDRDPNPSRDTIKEALSGNLCRCTGYQQIFDAVEAAAARSTAQAGAPAAAGRGDA
jgi:carbon-monoxide dehydrogenase small subunit